MPEKSKFKLKRNVGSHWYHKQKYNPGDRIDMYEHEAKKIMHKLERLDKSPEDKLMEAESGFAIMHLGDGEYNVVNDASGKAINDEPLTLKEARALAGDGAEIIGATDDDEGDAPDTDLSMTHRGSGRYAVIDAGGEPISGELFSKQEAEQIVSGNYTVEEVLESRDDQE